MKSLHRLTSPKEADMAGGLVRKNRAPSLFVSVHSAGLRALEEGRMCKREGRGTVAAEVKGQNLSTAVSRRTRPTLCDTKSA